MKPWRNARPAGSNRLFAASGFRIAAFLAVAGLCMANGIDLGTVAYGIDVNASIFDVSAPSQSNTYVFEQLLQNPDPSINGLVLDSGRTVGQELTALGYVQNPGELDYYFPDVPTGGSYAWTGAAPSYPPSSELPGTIALIADLVTGNQCTGQNSVGSTIHVDPTEAASTFAAIAGCHGVLGISKGYPTSSTSTVPVLLGTIGGEQVEGEVVTTDWESSGQLRTGAAAAPEPSSLWLIAGSIAAICAFRTRSRA